MSLVVLQDRTGLDSLRLDGAYIVRTSVARLLLSAGRGFELVELVNSAPPAGGQRSFYVEAQGAIWWPSGGSLTATRLGDFERQDFRELNVTAPARPPYRLISNKAVALVPASYLGAETPGGVGIIARTTPLAIVAAWAFCRANQGEYVFRMGGPIAANIATPLSVGAPLVAGGTIVNAAAGVTVDAKNTPYRLDGSGLPIDATGFQSIGGQYASSADWEAVTLRKWVPGFVGANPTPNLGRQVVRNPIIVPAGWWFFLGTIGGVQGDFFIEAEEVTDGWQAR